MKETKKFFCTFHSPKQQTTYVHARLLEEELLVDSATSCTSRAGEKVLRWVEWRAGGADAYAAVAAVADYDYDGEARAAAAVAAAAIQRMNDRERGTPQLLV